MNNATKENWVGHGPLQQIIALKDLTQTLNTSELA